MNDGKGEEQTFLSLLKTVSHMVQVDTYLECIDSLLDISQNIRTSASSWKGSWSRVAFLGSQLRTNAIDSETESNSQSRAECAISSAIRAKSVLSDPGRIPIILCLCRRLLISDWSEDKDEKGFSNFHRWLLEASKSGREVTKAIIESLSEIVHLEPLRMLRISYRIFTASVEIRCVASTYLDLLRTRIGEVNPTYLRQEASKVMSSQQNEKNGLTSEVLTQISDFVSYFAEKRGKVSPKLIREMNFRRYYFSTVMLPVLLKPDLIEHIQEYLKKHEKLDKHNFDEHRVDLIRELAFKRKDCAIKTSQAKSSIKAIERFIKEQRTEKTGSNVKIEDQQEVLIVTKENSLIDIMKSVVKTRPRSKNQGTPKGSKPKKNVFAVLVEKIKQCATQCETEVGRTKLALDLTHACLSAAITADEQGLRGLRFQEDTSDQIQQYRHYWTTSGQSLVAAIEEILASEDICFIVRKIEYQLYALACLQHEELGEDIAFSLAVLLTTLQTSRGRVVESNPKQLSTKNETLTNPSITSILIHSLPLRQPHQVRFSAVLVAHCLSFHTIGEELGTLTQTVNMNGISQGTQLTSSTSRSQSLDSLLFLLQWLTTNPFRLIEPQVGEMNNNEQLKAIPVEPVILMIRFASQAIAAQYSSIIKPISIRNYITVEKRCGWSRPEQVRHTLHRYKEMGFQTPKILQDVVISIVENQFSDNDPASTLILQGLSLFLSEDKSSIKIQPNNSCEDQRAVLQQVLDHFNAKNSIAAALTIDMLRNAEYDYFSSVHIDEALFHVECVFVPLKWPFTRDLASYILRAVSHDIVSTKTEKVDHYFMAIGCIVSQQGLIQIEARQLEKLHCSSLSQELSSNIWDILRDLSKVMQLLTSCDRHVDFTSQQSSETQLFLRNNIKRFPRIIAVSAILCAFSTYQRQSLDQRRKVIFSALDQIDELVSSNIVTRVYRTMLGILTILPFARESDNQLIVIQSDNLLKELSHRLIRVSRKDIYPSWSIRKMDSIEFLSDKSLQVILHWIGIIKTDHSTIEQLGTSLPFNMCMGRLMSSTLFDNQNEFLLVHQISNEVALTLVHNLFSIYCSILNQSHRNEVLTDKCMVRLQRRRKELSQVIIRAIVNIFTHVRRMEDIVYSDFVDATLSSSSRKNELEGILLTHDLR